MHTLTMPDQNYEQHALKVSRKWFCVSPTGFQPKYFGSIVNICCMHAICKDVISFKNDNHDRFLATPPHAQPICSLGVVLELSPEGSAQKSLNKFIRIKI